MDKMEPVWHRETVDAGVERTLRDLHNIPILKSFYLAVGTGLALRLGHRRSLDLDFFLGEDFNEDYVLQKLQHLEEFALNAKEPGTIYANIRKTKVSFLRFHRQCRADTDDGQRHKVGSVSPRTFLCEVLEVAACLGLFRGLKIISLCSS